MFGFTWKIKNSSTVDVNVTLTRQNASALSLQVPSGQEITQDVGTACVSKLGVKGIPKKIGSSLSLKQMALSQVLSQTLIENPVPDNGCKDYAIEIDNLKETVTFPEHTQEEYNERGYLTATYVVPAHTEEQITIVPKPSLIIKFLS